MEKQRVFEEHYGWNDVAAYNNSNDHNVYHQHDYFTKMLKNNKKTTWKLIFNIKFIHLREFLDII